MDTTRSDMKHTAEAPAAFPPPDFRKLYEKEKRKTAMLYSELSSLKDQSQKYAEDLFKAHVHAKTSQGELEKTNQQLLRYAGDLRNTIGSLKSAHNELEKAYYDTIHRLALAAEYKDKDTGTHIARICCYTVLIAERLGLSRAQMQSLFYAAPMHDVGKIGIPDQIILKPTRLSADEFRIMQKHTIIGSNMLSNSKAEILTIAQQIALWHHERWDGSGYPHRLSGTAIPQFCRITALADTFDALMTRRPYKEAFPVDKTCEIINGERGKHFDPDIVDVFNANRENFLKIENEVSLVKDRPMAEIIRKSTGLNISLGM